MSTAHHLSRKGNFGAAGVLLIVGVAVFTQTADLRSLGTSSDPGAASFPRLIAGTLIVLALFLARQQGTAEALPSRADGLRVVATLVLLVVYSVTMETIGYIGATTLFLIAALLLMGIKNWFALTLIPALFSTVIFFLFYTVFGVSLPREFLEGLIS